MIVTGFDADGRPLPVTTVEATHRCTVCGALWVLWPPDPTWPEGHPLRPGSWSCLTLATMGKCCDNEPMGAQIEPLGADAPAVVGPAPAPE